MYTGSPLAPTVANIRNRTGNTPPVNLADYRLSSLFQFLKSAGSLSEAEMLRTFNLGVGLVAVTRKEDAAYVIDHLKKSGLPAYRIGEIVEGAGRVETTGMLPWLA